MTKEPEDFYIYRRNLPHFRSRGRLYFVTWRLARGQTELTKQERSDIVSALKHFDENRYELLGFVVMNDHVHVIVWPGDDHKLEDILHSWKSFTANQLQRTHGRQGVVWQGESFDRVIRNEEELREKLSYVLNNPRKRWPDMEDYEWVWVKGL